MADQVIGMQLKQLNSAWIGILNRAADDKKAFNVIAQQCSAFYSPKKGVGFMWQDDFKKKYMGPNVTNPTFQVTIAKAFEYVAIIGPLLYWQYPYRNVSSNKSLEIDPQLFGNDPMKAQFAQQLAQMQMLEDAKSEVRNQMYSKVLNYIQREQPGGGLAQHSELAINESLVKGRGCLWTEPYKYPGSGRTLVGSFFDSVNNLLVDPDCPDPTLCSAKWIARRRRTPYWELEKKFGLPKNFLRDKAQFETAAAQGVRQQTRKKSEDKDGIEWYEVYTRCGVGVRIDGARTAMDDAWDEVVGDYAYLAICKACDYPLNCTPEFMSDPNTGDEEIAAVFEWPCGPLWADDKWPVSCLDYYHDTTSAWPIAPLAAGLGELICLNVLVAAYISGAYESRQSLIGYLRSAAADVEKAIKSGESPCYIPITDNVNKNINEVISFINRPEANNNLIEAIQFTIQLFEQRTGLSELMYGSSSQGGQDRSAAATNIKNDRIQIRPDFMAKKVASWQSEIAQKEAIVMRFHMTAEDVAPLLGQYGAFAWQELVENEDPEVVIRGTKCTVEASDVRKPDKNKETANMQQLLTSMLPVLSQYAFTSQDFEPWNAFVTSVGESMEQDVSKWLIHPQPNPMVEQQQQLAMDEQQAKSDKLRADAEKSRAGAQQLTMQFETDQQMAQHKMQMDQMTTEQKLAAAQADTQHKMMASSISAEQKMAIDAAKAQQDMQATQATEAQKMMIEQAKAKQQREQQAAQFWQIMQEKIATQRLREQEMKAKIAMQQRSGGNTNA